MGRQTPIILHKLKRGGVEGPGTWQCADLRHRACLHPHPPSIAAPDSTVHSFTCAHLPAVPTLVSIP
jgi:hypothetical protein